MHPHLLFDMQTKLNSVRLSHSLHSNSLRTQLSQSSLDLSLTGVFSVANSQLSYTHPFNSNDL